MRRGGCMLGSREVTPAGRTARRHFLKLFTRIEPVQIIRYQELPGLAELLKRPSREIPWRHCQIRDTL